MGILDCAVDLTPRDLIHSPNYARTWFWLILLLTPASFLTGQMNPTNSTNQPVMRTNPGDVRLATLASSVDATSKTNNPDATSDQWKTLAAPQVDPMVSPSTSKIPLASGSETKPKAIYKKDDYGPQTGWGIRTGVGPAIQQSISARAVGGSIYETVQFNPGFRMDLGGFYNVTNGFDFGLESGFIYNSISSVGPIASGSEYFGNGQFYQIPLLANMRFQIPNSGKLRGYCTGGFGGVFEYISISSSPLFLGSLTKHEWNYAFQLGLGLQYNLVPGLDLETSFKTLITPNPLIFSDGTSQVKASYNYALEVGLAYRF